MLTTIIDAECKVNETETACGCEISHAATDSQSKFLGSLRLSANMILSVVGMCKMSYFNRSIHFFGIHLTFPFVALSLMDINISSSKEYLTV